MVRSRALVVALTLAACKGAAPAPALPWGDRSDKDVPLGLDGASIVTDDTGVYHVFAKTDADLLKAQGYLHAKDRLFQLLLFRAVATGDLESVFGQVSPKIHGADLYYRALNTTPRGKHVQDEITATLPADLTALVQAYADGINFEIARVKAGTDPLPQELATLSFPSSAIAAWTVTDTIALGRLQSQNLSTTDDQELQFSAWVAALPQAEAGDLLDLHPITPAVILPGFLADKTPWQHAARRPFQLSDVDPRHLERLAAAAPQIEAARALLASIPTLAPKGGRAGSNDWTVSGALTDDGVSKVCNDPHLSLAFPPNFHFASLDSVSNGTGTLQIAGAAFPGIPGVILGHNASVAWGATVAGYDVTDLYLETITPGTGGNPDTVLFKGQQVPIVKVTEQFSKGAGLGTAPDVIELVPHHGPILPGTRTATSAITIKWTGMEPTPDLVAVAGIWRAKTVDDMHAALASFGVGAQNWVFADTAGHIGYDPHACIPKRTGDLKKTPPWLVMPGDGTGAEWSGCIADADLPWARDPAQGFVATANNDIAGKITDGDPTAHGDYWYAYPDDFGFRAQRIGDLFAAKSAGGHKLSTADLRAIQHDVHSNLADRFLPPLFAAATAHADLAADPAVADALSRLKAWSKDSVTGYAGATFDSGPSADAAAKSDAVAASIFNAWWPRAVYGLLHPTLAGTTVHSASNNEQFVKLALRMLEHPDTLASPAWKQSAGDLNAVLLGALKDAVAFLPMAAPGFTSDPSTWLWGRLHSLTLGGFLDALGIANFDDGPYPAFGEDFTVNVSSFTANGKKYSANHGPNLRACYDVSASGVSGALTWPGGESGNPGDSRSHDQLVNGWLLNKEVPLWTAPADVGAHVASVVTLK